MINAKDRCDRIFLVHHPVATDPPLSHVSTVRYGDTDLSVSVDYTFAEVEVRAGRAIVAQLLLRLDDAQQPVDDVVVQRAAAARATGRQPGRHLDVGPQIPRVPRPAVPYARA